MSYYKTLYGSVRQTFNQKGGLLVHLFLPERHMKLWSDKIGEREDLQGKNGTSFKLDVMRNETISRRSVV